ncbi:hypothetical protein [Microlunatus antarcticus]|uniref:Zn-dependent alcohol dehydrogenase n=1 Tax=Microlunatus antarcticus TaxID=53388 RepID=A0A7W5P6G8_9ACTN|nr:hypothetical protein [Microlunatus antarcticus]MBB3326423.1 Zn-dependent alcohol dehydrogenase [Microlunatus antarcticus]
MAADIANHTQNIAVDLDDSRLELARDLGATGDINTTIDKLAEVGTALTAVTLRLRRRHRCAS